MHERNIVIPDLGDTILVNKNNIKNTQNLSKSESIDIMKNYNSP